MKSARRSILPYLVVFAGVILFSINADASVAAFGPGDEDPSCPIKSWFDVIDSTYFEVTDQAGSLDVAVMIGSLWMSEITLEGVSEEACLNINRSRTSKRRFKPDNDCEIWQIIFGMSSMIA